MALVSYDDAISFIKSFFAKAWQKDIKACSLYGSLKIVTVYVKTFVMNCWEEVFFIYKIFPSATLLRVWKFRWRSKDTKKLFKKNWSCQTTARENFTVNSVNTACWHNNKKLRAQTFRKCRNFLLPNKPVAYRYRCIIRGIWNRSE